MRISGWGRFPVMEAEVYAPSDVSGFTPALRPGVTVARGLGRSYGDSSLAPNMLSTAHIDHLLAFDSDNGVLTCEAGASFDTILCQFMPRGWFLPVTPGTRFVTVGGAIASDVHGKNHHIDGSFSEHVLTIELLLGNGEIVTASRDRYPDLFYATCGGMGLTGIILRATIRLLPIRSNAIIERTIKAPDLETALEALSSNLDAKYSVAWIDCVAKGRAFGRSLIMLGEHANDGELAAPPSKMRRVPMEMPSVLLNPVSIRAFNALYYWKGGRVPEVRQTPVFKYFYPLDALADWNLLYGRNGFVQYQFVVPTASGKSGLEKILHRISQSGRASPLAVLKRFGAGNASPLSFPIAGYTLAVDFKAQPETFDLMDELDLMVLNEGGRLYLAKDARMKEDFFKASYPRWREFEEIRERYHAIGRFASSQSTRLGLG